jgi:iron(III) transport system permease protein
LRLRTTITALLALFIALPLVAPLSQILAPSAWPDGATFARVATLAGNTGRLLLGTLLLAVPIGIALAVLLERTTLPARSLLGGLLWLPLFVPLPLFTSGWQAVLGADGWMPAWASEYSPWALGIGSAVWIHAMAGLPWVALIVRSGLRNVERELEEDALLVRSAPWVLWRVTLPRSLAAIGAAALWVALMTAGEISVADLMQVRTFAEEVNTQIVSPERDPGGGDPLGRAVVVSLAWVGLVTGVILWLARRSDRLVPRGVLSYRPALRLALGVWGVPLAVGLLSLLAALAVVPIVGLAYRAGVSGSNQTWTWAELGYQLRRSWGLERGLLSRTLLGALATGLFTTTLAFLACWTARGSAWFRAGLLVLVAVAWAMPGPVVGLGAKEVFRRIVDWTSFTRLPAQLLWHGPSILPVVLVHTVRMFPFAVAILWPVIRLIPRELFEAARLDGLGPIGEVRAVVWPPSRRACVLSVLAVLVLSLGEISAAKIVSTPDAETFAEVVWTQMHYGVGPDLAARCLMLLGVVFAGAGLLAIARRR